MIALREALMEGASDGDHQDRLAYLRGEVQRLETRMREICEGRQAQDFNDEEIQEVEELDEMIDQHRNQIRIRETMAARLRTPGDQGGGGHADDPPQPPRRRTRSGDGDPPARNQDPRCGFADMGDFTRSVAMACAKSSPQMDPRLATMAASTWSSEGAGPDGGFLVPPEFSSAVETYVFGSGSVAGLCSRTPVQTQLHWPTDEDPPWASTGPQVYWTGEAKQITQSKLNLKAESLALSKLCCLVPVTEELMEDAPQLAAYLQSVISGRMRWKVDDGVINGTGAGQMKGILQSGAINSIAKESGQSAATINSTNVLKMWQGMLDIFRPSGTWLFNQDCELQLLSMVIAGTSSDMPVYLPSGPQGSQLAGSPYGALLGRRAMPHQACQTLGTVGDILFCDFSQYIIGQRTSGPQTTTSMHLWFDYDLLAVKATWRITGKPRWSSVIDAAHGTADYSPYVSLATRS